MNELESAVNGPDDLPKVRVGTVRPSAGWRFCERRGLRCRAFRDADAAVTALARDQVDALVYEAPILQYQATKHPSVRVLPGTFENHGYGLGLRTGSPLRERVNLALLEITAEDSWRTTMAEYLGAAP